MAREGAYVWREGLSTVTDLSAKQFYIVKLDTGNSDGIALCSATTDRCLGVLQNKPKGATGVPVAAEVLLLGISKVYVDGGAGAISIGSYIGTDTSGRGVVKTTPDETIIGIAMEASTITGDIITVLVMPFAFFRTAAS
jgi:hypothetical protein